MSDSKPVFSIICAYNDRATLDRVLLHSLRRQSLPCEVTLLDNTQGNYKNGAAALNLVASKATADYLVFAHQDVALLGSDWLERAGATLRGLGAFGAAGVAGNCRAGIKSSVWHGTPARFSGGSRVRAPELVQTLDGCLLIVRRPVFMEQGFDQQTCKSWHLYVADYCLDQGRRGLGSYVLPHPVYHQSTGPSSEAVFLPTLERIRRKHEAQTETIYLTIGVWNTHDRERG